MAERHISLNMRIRNCSNQALLDLWSIENVAATLFYLRKLDSAIALKVRKVVPLDDIAELTSIKADVLHAGCFRGIVCPSYYRDAIERFQPFPPNGQYLFESFSELIDPQFLERFPNCADGLDEILDHAERFLGKQFCRIDLINPVKGERIVNDIRRVHEKYFSQLKEEAIQTRRAIPFEKIEHLLFDIDEFQYGAWRLDPEYQSIVSFTYDDSEVKFVFDLPFRFAESFLEPNEVRSLPAIENAQEAVSQPPLEERNDDIHNIVARLGSYYMDSLVRAVFVEEILRQCSFCLFAFADIEKLLMEPREVRSNEEKRFWYSVHALLCGIANLSKIFWSSEAKGKLRAAKLRQALEVDENSPFRARNFRNHFEHWDERMDSWALTLDGLENRWFVDGEIGFADAINFTNPAYTLRNFDMTNFAVMFQGERYELLPVKEAILALHQRAEKIFRSVPYCM